MLYSARDRHSGSVNLLRTLAGRAALALRDPVGERLDRERCRDGAMFRRYGAFVPWAL